MPIPVGHRVSLQYFERDVSRLHSAQHPMEHTPLVTDLETGIEYGCTDHFDAEDGGPLRRLGDAAQLSPRLREISVLAGRVVRVQVIDSHASNLAQVHDLSRRVWTVLQLEQEAPESGRSIRPR